MHPATVHGVGVITKLHFAIFAPFKESMTLNIAQRSFKVIEFGTNRKRACIFLLVVNSNLDPILQILRLECRKSTIFPTPLLFRLFFNFRGVPFWGRSIMLGTAESEKVRLISREIIFPQFQPIWPGSTSTFQTDGQTDGQLAMAIRALRSIAR